MATSFRKDSPHFKSCLCSLLLMVAMTVLVVPAFAKTIAFDFEQPGVFDSFSTTNTTTQGFTFSPSCHLDWGNPVPFIYDSQWIGFDTFGCGAPATTNPNYLGPNLHPASIYVFFDSGPFSLTDLFVALPTWILTSSNGGFFDSGVMGQVDVHFAGPQWTDVTWLLFSMTFEGASPVGFDNLVLQVPEPMTMTLLVVALAGLVLTRRGNNERRSQFWRDRDS